MKIAVFKDRLYMTGKKWGKIVAQSFKLANSEKAAKNPRENSSLHCLEL